MSTTATEKQDLKEHIQSEIYHMAEILSQIDTSSEHRRSLIIIDELGGQTCDNSQISINFALMWSISEYLLSLPECLVIVSTHNHLLNQFCSTYLSTQLLKVDFSNHKCNFWSELQANKIL